MVAVGGAIGVAVVYGVGWRVALDAALQFKTAAVGWMAAAGPAVGDDAAELDRAIRTSADDAEFQERLRGFLQLDWAPAPPTGRD